MSKGAAPASALARARSSAPAVPGSSAERASAEPGSGGEHRAVRRSRTKFPVGRGGRVNVLVLVVGLAIAIPLGAVLVLSFGRDPREVPFVLKDQPAPAFALQTLDGAESVALADLAGHPVVINFWSTWCGPCKIEHPVLIEAARTWTDVRFLGVLYQDEAGKALSYLQREGAAYPHLLDPTGRISIDYGVAGVPETYFIDANGTIVYKQVGPVSWALLQRLLGREPG